MSETLREKSISLHQYPKHPLAAFLAAHDAIASSTEVPLPSPRDKPTVTDGNELNGLDEANILEGLACGTSNPLHDARISPHRHHTNRTDLLYPKRGCERAQSPHDSPRDRDAEKVVLVGTDVPAFSCCTVTVTVDRSAHHAPDTQKVVSADVGYGFGIQSEDADCFCSGGHAGRGRR